MTQLTDAQQKAWAGFVGGDWQTEVNVEILSKKTIPHMKAMSLS